MFNATTIYEWAVNGSGEAPTAYGRWLAIYGFLLTLGLLGDLAFCALAPLPAFWAHVTPQLQYLGIIFMAIRFGVLGGFAAACLAGVAHMGVAHIAVGSIACSQGAVESSRLAVFVAVGLLAGWAGRRGVLPSAAAVPPRRDGEKGRRDVSLLELGHLIPELVEQFRTPIASISGAGFVLEDADLPDDKRQEFVAIIRKECQRLGTLVQLLSFSEIPSSEYKEVDVVRLLDEVIRQCRSNANPQIGLQNTARRDLPRLRCAPDLIKHALQALTMDVIRAMPQHGDVELSAELVSGGMEISVHAQPEHDSPALEAALTRDRGRSDLEIVQQVANQHGGSVQLKPGTLGGITISVILPERLG